MPRKTYNNPVDTNETRLGIEQLLVAEYPTTWSPARIDVDAPPAGFVNLGAVVEDSPTFSVERETFDLETGLPMVLQHQEVTRLTGQFTCSLHSNSWRKFQYAFGNYAAVSSATLIATISSVTDQSVVSFAATSDTESLVVGSKYIFGGTNAEWDTAAGFETKVASITSDALTVLLSPTPIRTLVVNDVVGFYPYQQLFVGTAQIRQHALLGVIDFTDGDQVVHEFFKVQPAGNFEEAISSAENERISLTFNAFGVTRSDVPGASADELVVGRRVHIPAGQ
jgi:hypothetical protein